jgi:DNA invertase Pin-like site-specific DNA recombinase
MAITYVENINKKDDAKWEIVAFYEDDNVSGYTFERDGFLELLGALENDKIDVIIAKDLSRIGRHNSKTLLFIEKVKELGKRLILIDEGSGGYDTDKDDDDIIGIKTWYNERYVKDISKKIRSNIKTLQNKGAFLVETKYGYKKDPRIKVKL